MTLLEQQRRAKAVFLTRAGYNFWSMLWHRGNIARLSLHLIPNPEKVTRNNTHLQKIPWDSQSDER